MDAAPQGQRAARSRWSAVCVALAPFLALALFVLLVVSRHSELELELRKLWMLGVLLLVAAQGPSVALTTACAAGPVVEVLVGGALLLCWLAALRFTRLGDAPRLLLGLLSCAWIGVALVMLYPRALAT